MIELRALGSAELKGIDGETLKGILAQPKRFALLAYLAVQQHQGPRRRDAVIALFWPELDTEHARGALRQALRFLRRALGEGVVNGRSEEELGIEDGTLWCDASAFVQACAAGRWEQALALYRGDFFEGFFVSGASSEFDGWVGAERARLRDMAGAAARSLAQQLENDGDGSGVLQWMRRAVALQPDDEGSLQRLIAILDRHGDRAGAVREYEEFVRRLAVDHGVEPSPETQALIRAVRSRVKENSPPTHSGAIDLDSPGRATGPMPGGVATPQGQRPRRLVAAILAAVVIAATAIALVARRGARTTIQSDNVAVLPFRVTGASLEFGYLREGMIDLLTTKLPGDGGPRAMAPRTVMRAWREAVRSDGQDLSDVAALELSRRLGAGLLLQGAVVGTRSRLVLGASLEDAATGRVRAHAIVAGPSDSLPVLVDRLAAQLLVRDAGEPESRTATLTSTSLPALRAYLGGQAAYRRGEYTTAVKQFRDALELDSTFALANLGMAAAEAWLSGLSPLTVAYTNRARLSWRDRALLAALIGPEYPKPSPILNQRAAWERAVEAVPDQPEVWYRLGELYFHEGATLQLDGPQRWATQALERALALDSTFAAPLVHRIDLAVMGDDTALVRRLGARYALVDSAGDLAPYVHWRVATSLGDTAALAHLRARMNQMPTVSLWEIENIGQLEAIGLDDVERAAAVLQDRQGDGSARWLSLKYLYNLDLNRGRPKAALAVLAALDVATPAGHTASHSLILDGLFGDGDSGAAARAAQQLSRHTPATFDPDPDTHEEQLDDLCIAELWRVSHRALTSANRTIHQLQSSAPAGDSYRAPFQHLCAAMLRAIKAIVAAPEDADAAGVALDSMLQVTISSAPGIVVAGTLTLARLRESQRDFGAALLAIRRRGYGRVGGGGPYFLATCLHEDGRLAALSGDRAGAIRSYRKYLALRSKPEPALQPAVDQVRSALARLESTVQH